MGAKNIKRNIPDWIMLKKKKDNGNSKLKPGIQPGIGGAHL